MANALLPPKELAGQNTKLNFHMLQEPAYYKPYKLNLHTLLTDDFRPPKRNMLGNKKQEADWSRQVTPITSSKRN
jgi:hypothetical protein